MCYTENVQKIPRKFFITGLFLILIFSANGFAATGNHAWAQEDGMSKEEQKQQLQQQLQELEEEYRQLEEQKEKYRAEKESFQREINILDSEIAQIQIQIRRSKLTVDELGFSIQTNEATIELLGEKVVKQKELLANLLLGVYRSQDTGSIEIILANDTLSDFFDDVKRLEEVREGLNNTLGTVKELRKQIEKEQLELETRREEQLRFIQIQALQRESVVDKADAKERLLQASAEKEDQFGELARQTQRTISEVRNQLFVLEGAGFATSFGEAYEYAKAASQLAGVRPALLLSILKQESSWGQNVGRCFLRNIETADGVHMTTGEPVIRVMKVSRDVKPFLSITAELGKDPFNTAVSCWPQIYYQRQPFGFGGAMGPAQFLPSTWIGYRDSVSQLVGEPADPWRIDHAFVASAAKLAAAGASNYSYNSEWCAALIYYSGSCSRNVSINRFYADRVMQRAAQYQQDIDILEGN